MPAEKGNKFLTITSLNRCFILKEKDIKGLPAFLSIFLTILSFFTLSIPVNTLML